MTRVFATLLVTLISLTPLSLSAEVGVKLIGKDFKKAVWAESPKGVQNELWVLEKTGKIKILNTSTGKSTLFLDVTEQITSKSNEQGLLCLAFADDYLSSGRFYLYYTNPKGDTEICRYIAEGEGKRTCKASSRELLLTFKQDYRNHNGGWIGFGPDGYLYIGAGDGGSANDPKERAQDLSSYLGKLLRIDVSPTTGYQIPKDNPFLGKDNIKPEIYAYGLRNPWRCSWDRKTGDFYIADVGQNKWEEINFMSAGKGKGANYGWRAREGEIATPKKGVGQDKPSGSIDPVYVYPHDTSDIGGLSVTGGYVYRGPIASLQGKYFFADYATTHIWSFEMKDGKVHNFENWSNQLHPEDGKITAISSFGEDSSGNLLIISHKGKIYQVVEK